MTGQQKTVFVFLVATHAQSGAGTTHPTSLGCPLSSRLLFPKLDSGAIKSIRIRGTACFLLFKEQKFSCPCLAGHKASKPMWCWAQNCANFHSDCNLYLESAALDKQWMTHVSSPRRNKNNGKRWTGLDQYHQLQSVCGLQLSWSNWKATISLYHRALSLYHSFSHSSEHSSMAWTIQTHIKITSSQCLTEVENQ